MNGRNHTLIWQDPTKAIELLHATPKRIVLVIHPNPDGDAIGSALGLTGLLRRHGHECAVISPNEFPEFLRWMPGAGEIYRLSKNLKETLNVLKAADFIFVVDCNELSRLGGLNEVFMSSGAYKLMIDHHPDPSLKVDCILSDTSASSTAELVYRFIAGTFLLGYMDKDIADCLFTGIMTDTGCFSYNSSNRKTYETVAALIDYGIDKDKIYRRVYDSFSAGRFRLLGYCLNEKMEVIHNYNTAIISLSLEELSRFGFQTGDTEGFVNYPLSIRGLCFSVLLLEREDMIRMSFRSKGNFAVNDFARKHFRGGGHSNAAGGESYESLEQTVTRIKSLLPGYNNELTLDDD